MALKQIMLNKHAQIKSFFRLRINRKKFYNHEKPPVFYIIRRGSPNVGIFSCILTFLSHLRYAEEKGYLPIIDMMHFDNEYLYAKDIGQINAWEYYFKQPCNCLGEEQFSLKQAYLSKNTILSTGDFRPGYEPSRQFMFTEDPAAHDRIIWKDLWEKYIVLNEKTARHIEAVYQQMFSDDDRVMGVLCRGSDFFWHEPDQGRETGKIKKVIDIVETAAQKYKCNKIFLMTEDSEILEVFKNRFAQRLFFLEDERVSSDIRKYLGVVWKEKGIDLHQKGLNYLTAFYIIARCRWFVGTKTSASIFFNIVGEKEYACYFNLNEL